MCSSETIDKCIQYVGSTTTTTTSTTTTMSRSPPSAPFWVCPPLPFHRARGGAAYRRACSLSAYPETTQRSVRSPDRFSPDCRPCSLRMRSSRELLPVSGGPAEIAVSIGFSKQQHAEVGGSKISSNSAAKHLSGCFLTITSMWMYFARKRTNPVLDTEKGGATSS